MTREEVSKQILNAKSWLWAAQNAWERGDEKGADKHLSKALRDIRKAKANIPV